jgi:hypothetical protein
LPSGCSSWLLDSNAANVHPEGCVPHRISSKSKTSPARPRFSRTCRPVRGSYAAYSTAAGRSSGVDGECRPSEKQHYALLLKRRRVLHICLNLFVDV